MSQRRVDSVLGGRVVKPRHEPQRNCPALGAKLLPVHKPTPDDTHTPQKPSVRLTAAASTLPQPAAPRPETPPKEDAPQALAGPFAAALPHWPAPRSAPQDCSSADLVVGRLNMQYCVLDAKHGRGLFAKQGFAAGAFIARYSGEPLNTRTLPPAEQRPRTHMLRVPGTHDIIDGRPLADRLVRCRGGRGKAAWQPADSADLCQGYASLANAAPTDLGANVRMVFLPDDTALPGVRPAGYDAASAPERLKRDLVDLLPRGAYLVAKRDLPPNTEIMWHYQWVKE